MTAARLLVFPAVQMALFGFSLYLLDGHVGLAGLVLLASTLAMSFTLHISIHEEVHQSFFLKPIAIAAHGLASLLIGVPFAGYKWHHWNHHRYNNAIEDYSSTWTESPSGLSPSQRFSYALSWPMTLARAQKKMDVEIAAGEVPDTIMSGVSKQKLLPPLLVVALSLLISPLAGLLYIAHIYLGWVMISLHNYNQHPPITGQQTVSTSFDNKLYNSLFYNNGLHFEHHAQPATPHSSLTPVPNAPSVTMPHIFGCKVTGSDMGER